MSNGTRSRPQNLVGRYQSRLFRKGSQMTHRRLASGASSVPAAPIVAGALGGRSSAETNAHNAFGRKR